MKVKLKVNSNTVSFESLQWGDVFMAEPHTVLMKIEPLRTIYSSSPKNCINLKTGEPARFHDTEHVTRVQGTFIED